MHLTHKIALIATASQREYFARAAGTQRFTYNWALAEWNRQYDAGMKPTGRTLKKQFNATYQTDYPWVGDVHRDCHSKPFDDLQRAFLNFFNGTANRPTFKKKGRSQASFYV